jgi:predicted RNA-binding Zn-ribbon protein involved in translation (DUF1610 family)
MIWVIVSVLAALGIVALLYGLEVASRRSYRCPKCGEQIAAEYLKAKRCNTCGAPLREEA